MCRFLAYKGAPITLDNLLFQPKNSLIHQSYKAQERPEPLNGDGFGVGWYVPELDPEPAVFVSTTPAWNNRNLRYNASKVRSGCIFAHVRAASVGSVSEANCHPFHYQKFLFMHNGNIGGFKVIKRHLRNRLSDELYDWIHGQPDS
ncbi:MAG: class II glutamine amidotransferase, partial [bacterium]